MHDIHEANKILNFVIEQAKNQKMTKVVKVKLELGSIIEHGEILNPENLKFNLELLVKGTMAEGMEIEITKGKEGEWKVVEIDAEQVY